MLLAIGIVALIVAIILIHRDVGSGVEMSLLNDGAGNEALIVQGTVCGEQVLFLVDTAYAGAPVLSVSYMNCVRKDRRLTRGSVRTRYMRAIRAMQQDMSDFEMHETLNEFIGRGICKTFTSGCTMRLMGIGETSEAQSEMLLCPPITLAGKRRLGWDADVFVTNPLPGSTHILTSDYLLHNGPTLLEPKRGRLTFRIDIRTNTFDTFEPVMVGGAFVVPMQVAGVVMDVVVDTGASTTLSIASSSAKKLTGRCRSLGRKMFQSGVNGESICSDVVTLDVAFGSTAFSAVDVLVNSQDVEGADGYVGIGILRAFDLYLSRDCVGVRPNGLEPSKLPHATQGSCSKVPPCGK